jgi:hypothetical protein
MGHVGGKGRSSVGKVGEWYVESRCLQGCRPRLCRLRIDGLAPPVSVKDRWVGPREQILNIPITCWWYRPSKPSSLTLIDGGFTPIASMAGSGEKLGMDPWIGQPSCCRLCRESFFSRAVVLPIVVDDFVKGCYAFTVWGTYGLWSYTDWAWDVCGVLVRFFPTVCTSIWITVTLGYEYRLFVVVIT